jgi:hypothetical protein
MATVIIEPKKRCMKVSFCSEVCFLNGSRSTTTKIRVVVFVAGLDLVPAQKARSLRREQRRRDESPFTAMEHDG